MNLALWGKLTPGELYGILKLRTDVFFLEQRITETELDNRDQEPTTEHLWIVDALGVAAYLRVLRDENPEYADARTVVGRVVVREDRRGDGLARLLMQRVLDEHPGEAMLLHAQEQAYGLYARFGFKPFGEPYDEAGISHIGMYRAA